MLKPAGTVSKPPNCSFQSVNIHSNRIFFIATPTKITVWMLLVLRFPFCFYCHFTYRLVWNHKADLCIVHLVH